MSLYAKYIKEKEGKKIIENDKGFATYSFSEDAHGKYCYIEDIYVLPAFRKSGVAGSLADRIMKEAKGKGCVIVYGSVNPEAYAWTKALRVLEGYGMAYSHRDAELLYFKKDI